STQAQPSPEPANAVIAAQLEMALAAGASDEQIEVLRDALSAGEVTIEQLEQLHSSVTSCLTDNGFSVRVVDPAEVMPGSGVYLPDFLADQPSGMSDEAA